MNLDQAAKIFIAIKSDSKLSQLFSRLLVQGASSQQYNMSKLLSRLESVGADNEVLEFSRLLAEPKFAQTLYNYLNDEK